VWRVRFMVESPAQSGRMRTLIHRGPIPRGHVRRLMVIRDPELHTVQPRLSYRIVYLNTVRYLTKIGQTRSRELGRGGVGGRGVVLN